MIDYLDCPKLPYAYPSALAGGGVSITGSTEFSPALLPTSESPQEVTTLDLSPLPASAESKRVVMIEKSGPVFRPIDNRIEQTDLLTLCASLAPQSVDMILADLPYGTLDYQWDEIIPFDLMWAAFARVIHLQGAIVLCSAQPFTSRLICSNLALFKYEIVWKKSRPTGFMHAKNQILKAHENICVFSQGNIAHEAHSSQRMRYYPQKFEGKAYSKTSYREITLAWNNQTRPSTPDNYTTLNDGDRYPTSVIEYANDNHESIHPTQKPVALFEYLIRTYTQPGDLVLDPTCGSGTTAVAARNTDRRYTCGDNGIDERTGKPWAVVARERVQQTDPYQTRTLSTGATQPSLFAEVSHAQS